MRERLEKQFSEVDLAIMPSRTEDFGLVALEAMSAGLPVLVSANSGFGEALREVAFGSQYVIDSGDAEVWAAEIKKVWTKSREIRLQELKAAQDSYAAKCNWKEQCRELVEKMRCILNGMSCICLWGSYMYTGNFSCPNYSPCHICWKTQIIFVNCNPVTRVSANYR